MTTSTKGSGGKVRQRSFYVIRRYLNVDGHTAHETVAECANITQAHTVARRLSRQRADGVFNVKNRKSMISICLLARGAPSSHPFLPKSTRPSYRSACQFY